MRCLVVTQGGGALTTPARDLTPTPDPLLDNVEAHLDELSTRFRPELERPARRGQPRILPGVCMWAGMLLRGLHGCSSQRRRWRLLTQLGLWHYPRLPVSSQAVSKRLAQAGAAPLEELLRGVSAVLRERR